MANKTYDIIIIGYGTPNSFESKMQKEWVRMGHSAELFTTNDLYNMLPGYTRKDFMNLRRKASLDSFFRKYYEYGLDFIMVCQTWLRYKNDIHVPVFYYHRELDMFPQVDRPTYIIMNVPEAQSYLREHHPDFYYQAMQRKLCYIAVDPEEFNPNREKDLKGLQFVGNWEIANTWAEQETSNYMWKEVMGNIMEIPEYVSKHGLATIHVDGNILTCPSFEIYKDVLERSEAFLITTAKFVYITRRQMEAAACKTLNVIWVQNDRAEKVQNELGFYDRENCIMFRDKKELKNGAVTWTEDERLEMVEKAYNLILERHTYKHRAQLIIDIFERKKGFINPLSHL